jgi:hypothetical protein
MGFLVLPQAWRRGLPQRGQERGLPSDWALTWGSRMRRVFIGGRSFRQEVWTFASGGDLLGSLDSVHVPHPRVDLREQVRRFQPAEAPLRSGRGRPARRRLRSLCRHVRPDARCTCLG